MFLLSVSNTLATGVVVEISLRPISPVFFAKEYYGSHIRLLYIGSMVTYFYKDAKSSNLKTIWKNDKNNKKKIRFLPQLNVLEIVKKGPVLRTSLQCTMSDLTGN